MTERHSKEVSEADLDSNPDVAKAWHLPSLTFHFLNYKKKLIMHNFHRHHAV